MPEMEVVRERLLSCTRAEFVGWLDQHTTGAARIDADGRAAVAIDGGAIDVSLEERPPRRIALLVLPQLAVRMSYPHAIAPAAEAWIERFSLYTQRGGG